MSRTPARFTQADVARSIRAAKQAGAGMVELRPDGSIRIKIEADDGDKTETLVADEQEIVL
jgi:hypothetical protein